MRMQHSLRYILIGLILTFQNILARENAKLLNITLGKIHRGTKSMIHLRDHLKEEIYLKEKTLLSLNNSKQSNMDVYLHSTPSKIFPLKKELIGCKNIYLLSEEIVAMECRIEIRSMIILYNFQKYVIVDSVEGTLEGKWFGNTPHIYGIRRTKGKEWLYYNALIELTQDKIIDLGKSNFKNDPNTNYRILEPIGIPDSNLQILAYLPLHAQTDTYISSISEVYIQNSTSPSMFTRIELNQDTDVKKAGCEELRGAQVVTINGQEVVLAFMIGNQKYCIFSCGFNLEDIPKIDICRLIKIGLDRNPLKAHFFQDLKKGDSIDSVTVVYFGRDRENWVEVLKQQESKTEDYSTKHNEIFFHELGERTVFRNGYFLADFHDNLDKDYCFSAIVRQSDKDFRHIKDILYIHGNDVVEYEKNERFLVLTNDAFEIVVPDQTILTLIYDSNLSPKHVPSKVNRTLFSHYSSGGSIPIAEISLELIEDNSMLGALVKRYEITAVNGSYVQIRHKFKTPIPKQFNLTVTGAKDWILDQGDEFPNASIFIKRKKVLKNAKNWKCNGDRCIHIKDSTIELYYCELILSRFPIRRCTLSESRELANLVDDFLIIRDKLTTISKEDQLTIMTYNLSTNLVVSTYSTDLDKNQLFSYYLSNNSIPSIVKINDDSNELMIKNSLGEISIYIRALEDYQATKITHAVEEPDRTDIVLVAKRKERGFFVLIFVEVIGSKKLTEKVIEVAGENLEVEKAEGHCYINEGIMIGYDDRIFWISVSAATIIHEYSKKDPLFQFYSSLLPTCPLFPLPLLPPSPTLHLLPSSSSATLHLPSPPSLIFSCTVLSANSPPGLLHVASPKPWRLWGKGAILTGLISQKRSQNFSKIFEKNYENHDFSIIFAKNGPRVSGLSPNKGSGEITQIIGLEYGDLGDGQAQEEDGESRVAKCRRGECVVGRGGRDLRVYRVEVKEDKAIFTLEQIFEVYNQYSIVSVDLNRDWVIFTGRKLEYSYSDEDTAQKTSANALFFYNRHNVSHNIYTGIARTPNVPFYSLDNIVFLNDEGLGYLVESATGIVYDLIESTPSIKILSDDLSDTFVCFDDNCTMPINEYYKPESSASSSKIFWIVILDCMIGVTILILLRRVSSFRSHSSSFDKSHTFSQIHSNSELSSFYNKKLI